MRHGSRIITAALPVLFLAGHAFSILFAGEHGAKVSFAWLIAAPVLAAAACFYRGWKDGFEGWLAASLAMLCWAGGMTSTMIATLFLDIVREDRLSMLLYVLYGVPLIFALASPSDEKWQVRLVDAALAAALGYLYYVHVGKLISQSRTPAETIGALQLMFDVENLFIALFAIIRFMVRTRERAPFFRAMTAYAVIYLISAGYINHVHALTPYGGWSDLVVVLPFLILAWHAIGAPYRKGLEPAVSAPAWPRIVRAGGPLLIPVTLLAVSVLLVSYDPIIAIGGCVTASLGYGLRTTLVQLRNFEEQDELARLSHFDALTGIANRRRFDEVLASEWARRREGAEPLVLLMVDIDHFKLLNDEFGHAVGDQHLRAVAAALSGCARRDSDLVARYGGEEFAVILSGTDPFDAAVIAERMRASVEALGLPSGVGAGAGVVTISIGIACAHALDTEMARFVSSADAALYEAKRSGRNRVTRKSTAHLRAVDTFSPSTGGRVA
ncbi:GGDEF domain-containing protein [Novosphingobium guangzhouense]|uniref:diguanylate cyclase n=1 Tax=Novosphingobium guangzhouense TaxID=1850347 RepID=A0A2K2FYY2_9SPHN|nr:GGDEF domain-containing protein [Novosphingobium guangzhouense]PNU03958.1 diguanylate cyclase [Novosphingobium guangzhouense]